MRLFMHQLYLSCQPFETSNLADCLPNICSWPLMLTSRTRRRTFTYRKGRRHSECWLTNILCLHCPCYNSSKRIQYGIDIGTNRPQCRAHLQSRRSFCAIDYDRVRESSAGRKCKREWLVICTDCGRRPLSASALLLYRRARPSPLSSVGRSRNPLGSPGGWQRLPLPRSHRSCNLDFIGAGSVEVQPHFVRSLTPESRNVASGSAGDLRRSSLAQAPGKRSEKSSSWRRTRAHGESLLALREPPVQRLHTVS